MAYFLPRVWRVLTVATLAGSSAAFLVGIWTADPLAAKGRRGGKREDATYIRPDSTPVMAVVSINQQRVTVYDAEGAMLRSPVSTGKPGYETPPGIYSILQKKVEHYSNIYYDAAMPYMQRLTWSGIALHAGVLPGHPASGGCIRMPIDFAKRFYRQTKLGMRVIVVRDDISPAEIAHPAFFKPLPEQAQPVTAKFSPGGGIETAAKAPAGIVDAAVATDAAPAGRRRSLRSIAAAKSAAAAAGTKKAEEARRAAVKARADMSRLARTLRRAKAAKAKAERRARRAERLAETAEAKVPAAEQAQEAKGAAPDALAEAQQEARGAAQAALAEAQAKLEAVEAQVHDAKERAGRLREEAKAAVAAKEAAIEEAKEAARKLSPVTVLISRKTQHLYARQAREPLFESPVTITDADTPLGTYVFTALGYGDAETDLRWNVISMYRSAEEAVEKGKRRRADRHAEAAATDLAGARLALDRVAIPREAIDRISEIVSPGSTLIISDEALSRETGKGTDLIVVMSQEPQGGLKIRRRRPDPGYRDRRPFYRTPNGWSGPSFFWQ